MRFKFYIILGVSFKFNVILKFHKISYETSFNELGVV